MSALGRLSPIAGVLFAILFSACSTQTVCDLSGPLCEAEVKPGRCISNADCPADSRCVELPGAAAFHTCEAFSTFDGPVDVLMDGPVADAAVDAILDGAAPDLAPECQSNAACLNENTPICSAVGVCVACTENSQCAGSSGVKNLCDKSSGRCVACLASRDCSTGAPICAMGVCKACNAQGVTADGCKLRSSTLPVCGGSGQCVQCNASVDCTGATKPICDQSACRTCGTDAECIAKSVTAPGVCMNHQDGRCATTDETVIVSGGDLQAAVNDAVAGGKKLVLVTATSDRAVFTGPGSLSIIGKGQQAPVVGGGPSKPGISVTSGNLYVRGLALASSAPGISVTGGTAAVVSCTIRDNPGGGVYVDGGSLVLTTSTLPKTDLLTMAARSGVAFA